MSARKNRRGGGVPVNGALVYASHESELARDACQRIAEAVERYEAQRQERWVRCLIYILHAANGVSS